MATALTSPEMIMYRAIVSADTPTVVDRQVKTRDSLVARGLIERVRCQEEDGEGYWAYCFVSPLWVNSADGGLVAWDAQQFALDDPSLMKHAIPPPPKLPIHRPKIAPVLPVYQEVWAELYIRRGIGFHFSDAEIAQAVKLPIGRVRKALRAIWARGAIEPIRQEGPYRIGNVQEGWWYPAAAVCVVKGKVQRTFLPGRPPGWHPRLENVYLSEEQATRGT